MQLRESRLAAADLDAIFEYGVSNHGADAALDYLAEIESRYRQLIAYPRSGRVDPDLGPAVRSISCRSYRIHYEIEGDAVLILRILHKAAEPKHRLA